MVIDDARDREEYYRQVLSISEFDPIYVWTRREFEEQREIPVDGYIIDVFLDTGDWVDTNAAELLKDAIQNAPRRAPVFLVSQLWGDEKVLGVLKQAGELEKVEIVQYLAWTEFQQATEGNQAAEVRKDALRMKLLSELGRWHRRSGFRPSPDDIIRILLLADVQFGDPATDPGATFSENQIANVLKQNHNLPDLIVLAGDISHSGRPDQFKLAEERLALDLMGLLWGKNNVDRYRDRIVLVPGNHDVNLRFSACDNYKFNLSTKEFEDETIPFQNADTDNYLSHHSYALEPFRRFARNLTGERNWGDLPSLTWVDRRFVHCGIRFFVLNSVADLNSSKPNRASLNETALREINRSISDSGTDSIFSIAVSHHGLRPYGASDNETQINNWASCSSFFLMHEIRLWLCGHYHKFNVHSINSIPFNKTPLWVVQAPTSRISDTTRGFCVLELKRQAGKVIDAHVHHYVLENNTVEKRETERIFD